MRVQCLAAAILAGCSSGGADPARSISGHGRMLALLQEVKQHTADSNHWLGDAKARELRPLVAALPQGVLSAPQWWRVFQLGVAELWLGNEREAIRHLTRARSQVDRVKPALAPKWRNFVAFRLGVAYLRLAETQNCCARHTPESCILPLRGSAIHVDREGATGAIEQFTDVLQHTPEGSDLNLGARWLLNIASMTIGGYPDNVPKAWRIPPAAFESEEEFPRFANISARVGLSVFTLSGGVVADDFNNDGYLDLLITTWDTSGQMRYYQSNADGTFVDETKEAGLLGLLGGLNMVQGDYDNDGNVDVYVLRGAWLQEDGRHPNSLLRNLGGGRFRDVTFDAGLGQRHAPTQTAGWADYDNDGDLDLYVGNETGESLHSPCQLFRNNGDGTFTDVAAIAKVTNDRYTKGVSWGDYDGDRFPDLFVSNLQNQNRLYRNNRDGTFTDVAPRLGMTGPVRSFPAWFWDFDNDGNLDLYVSAYDADIWDLAAAALGRPVRVELARLWRGDGHGGFVDVAYRSHLVRPNSPMGSNFGDLDNDGYLDFYLGTGFPSYDTVMPNVMFHNRRGRSFADVTIAGGFAHLQKGHAVVFADLDNDGDQEIFEQMGGALKGDGFYDVLYENPGFANHWIAVQLEGTKSNRSAIGARIRIDITGDGEPRSIYRHVNSGGSFGANPLRQTIGLGRAKRIQRLEVYWPRTARTQVFANVPANVFIRIEEGANRYEKLELKRFTLGGRR